VRDKEFSRQKALEKLSLNGAWRLQGTDDGGGEIDVRASVPGVVHWDLERGGLIPDPFLRDNEDLVQWIGLKDWTYRRQFNVPAEMLDRRHVELVFEGLDTFARVKLNGRKVAATSNMFIMYRFDVKKILKPGRNTIEVKFLSPLREGLRLHRRHREVRLYEADGNPRPYVRKAQYSFGWDWGPKLPTSGIWRDVYVEGWDTARIESVYWRTLGIKDGAAKVAVTVEFAGTGRLSCRAGLSAGGRAVEFALRRRGKTFTGTTVVKRPRLWWPAGQGPQNLYRAEVILADAGGVADGRSGEFGIRTVQLRRAKDREGESFAFAINGREVFCKGANWIPADSYLPRISGRDYRDWVKLTADCNMNMLRVWGGGIYETEDFYRACDRRGIMVWQDFPFACAMYPEGKWFVDNVRREAQQAIKGLRNHPSLVLWCGNNENHWAAHSWWPGAPFGGKKIYDRVLPALVRDLDPSRPYWPGSPWGGRDPNCEARGDRHSWDVWSGWGDYRGYLKDNGRFISEFGFQAPPPMESVAEFGPIRKLHPQHPLFEHHNKQVGGPERLARFVAAVFPPPRNLEEFVYLTQMVQGEAIKTGVLHWRSRMPLTSGALYWQLNDCWPVCSWSAADYRRRPKALWYYSRRFFAPVTVRAAELKDGISAWVINDSPKTVSGTLSLEVMAFDGKGRRCIEKRVRVKAGSVVRLGPFSRADLLIRRPAGEFVAASFAPGKSRGARRITDVAFLARPKHLRLGDPKLKLSVRRRASGLAVTVAARRLAYGVFLSLPGAPVRFSDNFFTLLPGEKATVILKGEGLTVREARRRLRARSAPGGLPAGGR
jgi:beta-mannosidase